MPETSGSIEKFVLGMLKFYDGKCPKVRISRALHKEDLLGFGQDVNDVITHMIQMGLVTIDPDDIVEIVPDDKSLIYERQILHEALNKSPTLSLSIPSAITLLIQRESPINLREVLFYRSLRQKLGVKEYADGDIIYLKPESTAIEPEDERTL